MKKKQLLNFLFYVLALLAYTNTLAQKEGNIWYFGYNAGIDFNSGEPVALSNSAMYTWEGCANISDLYGNLLFYTNGKRVWNANHEQMPNGYGLLGHDSSTQAAVIVKKPGPNLIYMVFTVDAFGYENGLRYSEVDMGFEGGLGDINQNKNILIIAPTAEKIIAIQHENEMDYWIVTHLTNSSDFYSYLLSDAGIDTIPVVSTIDPAVTTNFDAIGYLRANRDGNLLALGGPGLWLYDFDKTTGQVSNSIEIYLGEFYRAYGLEFSHNNSVLYASLEGDEGKVYQYNLETGDSSEISNSRVLIGSGFDYGGALQMGPDNRIYHSGWNSEYLGVIENPNTLGIGCGYSTQGFYMDGKVTGIGLPNFKNSIYNVAAFSYENLCLGQETEFSSNMEEVDSLFWNFGDVESGDDNFSTLFNPNHYYSDPGFYPVSLETHVEETVDSVLYWLYIKALPPVDLGNDSTICEGQSIVLDASLINSTYNWQDQSNEAIFIANNPGLYYVDITQNQCENSDSIYLYACNPLLNMPNVFTPNGDGSNDYFLPLSYNDIRIAYLSIYDRWGKIILDKSEAKLGWNGRVNGNKSAEGTYFYIVEYQGVNNVWYNTKGYLTLLR